MVDQRSGIRRNEAGQLLRTLAEIRELRPTSSQFGRNHSDFCRKRTGLGRLRVRFANILGTCGRHWSDLGWNWPSLTKVVSVLGQCRPNLARFRSTELGRYSANFARFRPNSSRNRPILTGVGQPWAESNRISGRLSRNRPKLAQAWPSLMVFPERVFLSRPPTRSTGFGTARRSQGATDRPPARSPARPNDCRPPACPPDAPDPPGRPASTDRPAEWPPDRRPLAWPTAA